MWYKSKSRLLILCLFGASLFVQASASTTLEKWTHNESPIEIAKAHSQDIMTQLIALAQEEENARLYSILQTTKMVFSDEMDATDIAFSSIEQNRLISISSAYVDVLASFIREHLQPKHEQAFQTIFVNALSDVILHEIGHHALDAFYNDYTPPTYISMFEEEAQDWAEQIKLEIMFDFEGFGRIVSLTALLAYTSSYPELSWHVTALGHKVDNECHRATHIIAEQICTSLVQDGAFITTESSAY